MHAVYFQCERSSPPLAFLTNFVLIINLTLLAVKMYERGAKEGKNRDTCARIHQESKELEKDERRLEEMLLDSDWLLRGNIQCIRATLAKIRKTILVLLRLETENITSTQIF